MTSLRKLARPRLFDLLLPALVTGIVLCLINYAMDYVMKWLGTGASKTFLNDVIVGILGSVAVFYFLLASRRKQNFENAKKRILLIGEINVRIREALEAVANSAMSEDRIARLRCLDEAVDDIDVILCDFSTHQAAEGTARYD